MAPGSPFGSTWWGRAWVDALERASLEPARLARGRTVARNGSVGMVSIAAGYASASVRGARGATFTTDVAVRTLAIAEWEQIADSIARTARHAAALLDGELDPGVLDDALAADITLLPRAGDLRPDCSCPDWVEPCEHAAALCYLVAAELDRDPFLLFLLRGLGRDELMTMVRARRAASSMAGRPVDAPTELPVDLFGVPAVAAWSERAIDEPLGPAPSVVAARPHATARMPHLSRTPWDVDLPRGSGIAPGRIDELADDAVARAWAMLADGAPSGLRAPGRADLARWASRLDDSPDLVGLARRIGIPLARLRRWGEAWRIGGDGGVAVISDDTAWSIDQVRLDEGREQLVELGHPRRSIALNYDSLRMSGNIWLVIGPDDRWYKIHGDGKHHELNLVGPPSHDVTDLVDAIVSSL